MREEVKKVRTKGKVVSEITVPIYEALDEIADAEPEERIVNEFNKANCIRLMGNERAKFSPTKAGKKKRRNIAFNLLTEQELMECARDASKLEEKLDSDEMQQRVDEHLQGNDSNDVQAE